jgi:hypothetical protein
MQSVKQPELLGWSVVIITTILMILVSGLILYPKITDENILTALRFSSLTTAVPFLLFFIAQPLTTVSQELGGWIQNNYRYLWLILTISHLIHLYQIFLYYQLGQSCPLTVWLVTAPLWMIMVIFSGIELMKPQLVDSLYSANSPKLFSLLYHISLWYIWLIFTLAFGLGAIAQHIPFYNIPAFVLFLAGAIFYGIVWWRRKATAL